MNSSFIKTILVGIWLGAIGTFTAVFTYLISHEQSINVPGEMSEALAGVAILLFCVLLTASAVVVFSTWRLKFP
jgi:NADH:ubiquinone oxidoreductase subunit 6 (subunit J)